MSRDTLLDSDLQALYMCEDEDLTQITDGSGNDRHLDTLGASTAYVSDDYFGDAPVLSVHHNETGASLAHEAWMDNVSASSTGTMTAWMKVDPDNITSGLLVYGPRFVGAVSGSVGWLHIIRKASNNYYTDLFGYWKNNNSVIETAADIWSLGAWAHITWMRVSSVNVHTYINGVLTTDASSIATDLTGARFDIGNNSGSIADVAACFRQISLHSRNLTTAEIAWLANPRNTLGDESLLGIGGGSGGIQPGRIISEV